MPSPRRPRPGFTLVEMLVVIAIIGILAAILIPAVYSAVVSARHAAIVADMTQLEMAVEQYKNAKGDYPPNFFEDYANTPWGNTIVARHLMRGSRQASGEVMSAWSYNGNPLLGSPDANASDPTQIDAAETLVFWLGGLSKSALNPVRGPGGPLVVDSTGAALVRPLIERESAFFPFKESQLSDVDGDGLPEYCPPQGERAPYVYFDGRSYDNLTDNDGNGYADDPTSDDRWAFYPPTSTAINQVGMVRPYVTGSRAGRDGSNNAILLPVYANDKKFQIVSAGLDGLYGEPGGAEFVNARSRKVYLTEQSQAQTQFPDAISYKKQDLDNIANFSGKIFEDVMP